MWHNKSLLHYFLSSSLLSQNVTLSIVTDSIELKHKQPENILKEPAPTPPLPPPMLPSFLAQDLPPINISDHSESSKKREEHA